MIDLSVSIGELTLRSPIMPASGAFGYEMGNMLDFKRLGALVPKSITKYPRGGNATPRVCEVYGGMINSIGIQSKGVDYYIEHMIPNYAKYNVPIISSISADSIDEFCEMSERIAKHPSVAALELNISCPNLKDGGRAFGMDADISYELVKKVRDTTSKPIIPKLSPNVTSIQEIAIACTEAKADALNVANTLLAMAIDIHTRKPKIGNDMGGLSGPSVKPVIVRMVYQVSQVSNLPIIACGGVMTGDDAIEMIVAGATAVQVGTASFIYPNAMETILDEIVQYMEKYQIQTISELVGSVKSNKVKIIT